MDAEGGTGEVSRRACISGTDGSACCLPDVLAGNVVLKGLRLGGRAYREDIVISSASPIHSEGMGGVIDGTYHSFRFLGIPPEKTLPLPGKKVHGSRTDRFTALRRF